MFKDENELIETTKATAELLEKEIDNEDTKIPNAQSIQLRDTARIAWDHTR